MMALELADFMAGDKKCCLDQARSALVRRRRADCHFEASLSHMM